LSAAGPSEAPHISHTSNEGWFSNVHRGHRNVPFNGKAVGPVTAGASTVVCRLDMDATAAFTTCTTGGLIPQARHGGMFVCVFAVAGSKLEGIGLEKEHIGHTQVALGPRVGGAGVIERDGLS
jgi:hypothetical protein